MKKIFSAAAIIAFLGSCSISKNSIKTNKLIAVEINLNTVIDDKVEVVINPKKIKEETITYHIPAIVPGTYMMSNYGKFISNFKYCIKRNYYKNCSKEFKEIVFRKL